METQVNWECECSEKNSSKVSVLITLPYFFKCEKCKKRKSSKDIIREDFPFRVKLTIPKGYFKLISPTEVVWISKSRKEK